VEEFMIKNLVSALILFLILSGTVFSGTIDPNTDDSKYVEYGKKFHSVVKICCFDGKGMSCGSAVVIAPDWIITAAHVVENCHSWTVSIGEEKYNVDKMIPHAEYKTEIFGHNDIALGHLEKPINLDFYPAIYEKSDEVGRICSISGWGFTGTFNTGTKFNDGQRRGGSNFIDKIERKVLICSPSRKHEKMTELEYIICSGDSGGGLFIDGKLAGINSSVIGYDGKSDSTYGDESCHTRVSLYKDWIKKTVNK
jgi:secreted trypsin-like serine protease